MREIGRLPLDDTRAALETSAAIAAVSLRASIEFLRVAADVAQVLELAELRAWGELGRRLTMTDTETGVSFFIVGVGEFATVPSDVRPFVFQVCARQVILSATTAAETFRNPPAIALYDPVPLSAVRQPSLPESIFPLFLSPSGRTSRQCSD